MTLPSDLTTVTIVGTYLDSSGNAIVGEVAFQAVDGSTGKPIILTASDKVILPAQLIAKLDSTGAFSITLVVTDSDNLAPTGWCWKVKELFPAGRVYLIQPTTTDAPGPVDLSELAPEASPGSPVFGAVHTVTATDGSIVVTGETDNPTIATGTLDVIATQHPPAAAWSNNSKKITALANGTVTSDAAAYGQIVPLSTITAAGDLLLGSASAAVARLAKGAAGQVLGMGGAGSSVAWQYLLKPVAKAVAYTAAPFDFVLVSGGKTITAPTNTAGVIWGGKATDANTSNGFSSSTGSFKGPGVDGTTCAIGTTGAFCVWLGDGTSWHLIAGKADSGATVLAGHLAAANVTLASNTLTEVLATATLEIGTWIVNFGTSLSFGDAVSHGTAGLAVKSGTATLQGKLYGGASSTAVSSQMDIFVSCTAIVTAAAVIKLQAQIDGADGGLALGSGSYANALPDHQTGYTAVRVA